MSGNSTAKWGAGDAGPMTSAAAAPRLETASREHKGRSHSVQMTTMRQFTTPPKAWNIGPDRWIADIGCGADLIGTAGMTPQYCQNVEASDEPLCLHTAHNNA